MTVPRPLASLVRSDVSGVLWPAISSGTSATLAALVLHLQATERMAPDDLVAEQHRQLVPLAGYAARHSPQFRQRLRQARVEVRDLGTPDGLRRLPALHRRDLQSAGADLYCRDVPASHQPVEETRTSGSSGEPVAVKRTAIDQLLWSAMTIREHLWYERDVSKGLAVIRATVSAYSKAASWGPPISLLFATGPSQRIPITASLEQQLTWLVEFKPDNLVIYPSTLDALARHCRHHGVSLPGLRHIRSIGEALAPDTRKLAAKVFSARVEDVYSSQEMGVIAVECPESGLYHVMAESVIVEVVDDGGAPCKEGEVGRVVITALHNFATPLIRYDIGDYAEVAGPCPCGRGLPTLRRILGRVRNMLVTADGRRYWPLFGTAKLMDLAPLLQHQFVQKDYDLVEARLVTSVPLTRAQEEKVRQQILTSLPAGMRLQLVYCDRIPRNPGGKFEDFVSEITARPPAGEMPRS